jgi:hypothetical protein
MADKYVDIFVNVQITVTVPEEHAEFEEGLFDEFKKIILSGQEQSEHHVLSLADDIKVAEL